MGKVLALSLALLLPASAQVDPAILHIRVIEGEGAVYSIGSRATRGVTVQVTDETGKPVAGATVTFRLPADGPTGTFSSGERVEAVATAADGAAQVWGMQWNRTVGPLEVRITAAKGQASAGAICGLYLTDALISADPQPSSRPPRHTKLWIALGIVGAVAAGVAVSAGGRSGAAANSSVDAGPRIGTPTITIGRP